MDHNTRRRRRSSIICTAPCERPARHSFFGDRPSLIVVPAAVLRWRCPGTLERSAPGHAGEHRPRRTSAERLPGCRRQRRMPIRKAIEPRGSPTTGDLRASRTTQGLRWEPRAQEQLDPLTEARPGSARTARRPRTAQSPVTEHSRIRTPSPTRGRARTPSAFRTLRGDPACARLSVERTGLPAPPALRGHWASADPSKESEVVRHGFVAPARYPQLVWLHRSRPLRVARDLHARCDVARLRGSWGAIA